MTESLMINHPTKMMKNVRIQRMMLKHGLLGYGLFWIVLEYMGELPNLEMSWNKKSLEELSRRTSMSTGALQEILKEFAKEYKILNFDAEKRVLTSGLLVETPENMKLKDRNKKAEELFLELWALYPEKKGKGSVSMSAKLRLLDVGKEEMERSIERYIKYIETTGYAYKNGSTFFNTGYVDYLDAEYERTKNGGTEKDAKQKVLEKAKKFDEIER